MTTTDRTELRAALQELLSGSHAARADVLDHIAAERARTSDVWDGCHLAGVIAHGDSGAALALLTNRLGELAKSVLTFDYTDVPDVAGYQHGAALVRLVAVGLAWLDQLAIADELDEPDAGTDPFADDTPAEAIDLF